MSGVDVLRDARSGSTRDIVGIMMTAFASTETAVEALRLGAYDYVDKPFDIDELKIMVTQGARAPAAAAGERAAEARAAARAHQFSNIIGTQRADAGGLRADRDDRADRQHRADHRRVGHRQGAGRARDPLQLAARATGRSSPSTAARCPRRCSSRSCSATCAAPSPAPTQQEGADRGRRHAARSSSTRSAR